MASAEEIAKSLAGAIGANDEESTVDMFLDTGYPPFNYALSNRWDAGLACGRMVEVSGPSASGKTAIASFAMSAAQKAGGIAGFNDHERTFQAYLAAKIGLDLTPGRFIYKKPRTFEESLDLCIVAAKHIRAKKLIPVKAPIAWAFDSLASMVPRSALFDKDGNDKDISNRSMHDNTALARATSAAFPAFAQYCEELGICAIFLNQIRMKIGVVFGDPRTTPGGQAPEFYFSQRVMLNAAKKISKGEGAAAEVLGMEISATVNKNKVARPFRKASWRFMFQPDGTGRFDVERSMIEFLADQKILITSKPGFVEWEGKPVNKETLARRIEAGGPKALQPLLALLPAAYEAPVVAEVDLPAAA